MSLLATASPFNSENDNNNDISVRRQQSHNRTLKQRREASNNNSSNKDELSLEEKDDLVPMRPNVAAMMKALNNQPSEDNTGLADFNPPSNAELTKAPSPSTINGKNIGRQGFTNLAQAAPYEYDSSQNNSDNQIKKGGPKANDDRAIDISKYNSLPSSYANAYYQQIMNSNNVPNIQNVDPENYQILNERLNHIINLLEEQQNSKTNSVTEELILYCFLGVFVIFIVDSFARVGKYSR